MYCDLKAAFIVDKRSEPGPHFLTTSAVLELLELPKPGRSRKPSPQPPTFICFPFPPLNLDFLNHEL